MLYRPVIVGAWKRSSSVSATVLPITAQGTHVLFRAPCAIQTATESMCLAVRLSTVQCGAVVTNALFIVSPGTTTPIMPAYVVRSGLPVTASWHPFAPQAEVRNGSTDRWK